MPNLDDRRESRMYCDLRVKGSRQVKKTETLVVNQWHWRDDRECTEKQFQWNDV